MDTPDAPPEALTPGSFLHRLVVRLPADLRRGLPAMVVYEIAFRLIGTLLGAPLAAWLVQAFVDRSGSAAVSNTAIARFLITPSGLATALVLVVGYLLGQLLLSAGFTTIAATALAGRPIGVVPALVLAARSTLCLLRFGLAKLAGLAVLFAPFLGLAGLTYGLLLAGHDINYYLAERPPVFYAALAIGAVLAAAGLAAVAWGYLRGLLIMPIVLFEGLPLREAFWASHTRMTGAARHAGLTVLAWHAAVAAVSPLVGLAYGWLAVRALDLAGERVTVLVLLGVGLLLVQGCLLEMLAFVQLAGSCLLTVQFYDELSGGRARAWADAHVGDAARGDLVPRWAWPAAGLLGVLALASTAAQVIGATRPAHHMSVTAHRGSSLVSPENTIAAIRQAIADGSDYAEIDLHLTADGVPVLVHDEDLKRVAGDPRRPEDLTLEQIRQLDVGARFDPKFAGERVPTLAEAIAVCRGRMRLNIELKPTKTDHEALAATTAAIVREERFLGDCFVTSLDRAAVVAAKRTEPLLRTGAIVSAAVGDVVRLDVEVLSVRTGLVSGALLDRAHEVGREVHAWTVDDPRQMGRLIDQGVDGLITNAPAAACAVRAERMGLPVWQRIVLGLQARLARR